MWGLGRGVVLIGALALWATGAGTALAQAPAAPADDVQALRERVAAYWAARVAGDARAQWELLEPRVKARVSAEAYRAGRDGVRYLAYQVEEASVEGAFATVKVRVLGRPVLLVRGQRQPIPPRAVLVEDPWIRIGGVWYRRLEEGPGAPPGGPEP